MYTPEQEAFFKATQESRNSILLNSGAGTGKTFTITKAAALLPNPKQITMVAFNKHIQRELDEKMRGTGVTVKTSHGLGWVALMRWLNGGAWGDKKPQLAPNDGSKKYKDLAHEFMEIQINSNSIPDKLKKLKEERDNEALAIAIRNEESVIRQAHDMLRMTMTKPDLQSFMQMCQERGITPTSHDFTLKGVLYLLKKGVEVFEREYLIDFGDMLYLAVTLSGMEACYMKRKYLFGDEVQDWNAAQLELILRSISDGGKLFAVGDPNQAIYAFAGADADSFWNIKERTNAVEMSLSVNWRCATPFIKLANHIKPDLKAHNGAPEGILEFNVPAPDLMLDADWWIDEQVGKWLADDGLQGLTSLQEYLNLNPLKLEDDKFQEMLKRDSRRLRASDLVLCRMTAPLVTMCIQLIKRRIPAKVRGRQIGDELVKIIQTIEEAHKEDFDFKKMSEYIQMYRESQIEFLRSKDASETQIQSANDRCDAIEVCLESFGAFNIYSLISEIRAMFEDDDDGAYIWFSTIHRAKGSEAERVFIIEPQVLPMRWENQRPEELEQEFNLWYVAVTRAKMELRICGEFSVPYLNSLEPVQNRALPPVNARQLEAGEMHPDERAKMLTSIFNKSYGSGISHTTFKASDISGIEKSLDEIKYKHHGFEAFDEELYDE